MSRKPLLSITMLSITMLGNMSFNIYIYKQLYHNIKTCAQNHNVWKQKYEHSLI